MKRLPLRDRIAAGVVADPATGCLLWQGLTGRTGGYGRISVGNRDVYVHRVAWELENGPVPDGFELDHVYARGCRYRHCVNVAHLELVTRRVNVERRYSARQQRRAQMLHQIQAGDTDGLSESDPDFQYAMFEARIIRNCA